MMNKTQRICMTGAAALGLGLAAVRPAAAAVTDSDKQFLSTAAQGDVNEIKLSQLAETKATDPKVKAFARKMVKDHMTLEVKMKPFADAWGLTPPAGPDAEHQAELDKLNGLSGADFDKEYMNAMDMDHHKALDAFTTEADTTTDAKFKRAVVNGKAVVKIHTDMADKMTHMS